MDGDEAGVEGLRRTVDGGVAAGARVTGEDVGGQHGADNVTQMRDVVDIGKGRGDEDVVFTLDGQDGLGGRHGEVCDRWCWWGLRKI